MELIFPDILYDTSKWEEGKYSAQLTEELRKYDPDIEAINTDIGHGADWPVIVVQLFNEINWSSFLTITGAGGLFLMGDKINKNINAWLEIVKKVSQILQIFKPARIDEYTALIFAFNDFVKTHGPQSEFEISVQIITFAAYKSTPGYLAKRPNSLYIINLKSPDNTVIYGIKSNNKIEFKHELSTHWIDF